MTPEQFDALAELADFGAETRRREAARLVMVEGVSKSEAARRTGISPAGSGQAVKVLEKTLELARVAVGG